MTHDGCAAGSSLLAADEHGVKHLDGAAIIAAAIIRTIAFQRLHIHHHNHNTDLTTIVSAAAAATIHTAAVTSHAASVAAKTAFAARTANSSTIAASAAAQRAVVGERMVRRQRTDLYGKRRENISRGLRAVPTRILWAPARALPANLAQ